MSAAVSGSAPVALLWDIDGTLLTTARAGIFALEAAASEILGAPINLQDMRTAGMTDANIALMILERYGPGPETATGEELLRIYERELPEALPRREGRVMPGVVEILEDLHGRDDVVSLLLSGNTPAGALTKLTHYGLARYLQDGGLCTGPGERSEIAARAKGMALEHFASGPEPSVYVIGDTIHDVACGKAVGARTIAVATGPIPREELEESEPWAVLDELPDPAAFRGLVGIPA